MKNKFHLDEFITFDFSNLNLQECSTNNCFGCDLCDCNCDCDAGDCDCNNYCDNDW